MGLGWRDRMQKELDLMNELEPLLKRRAGHREISGLRVYETPKEYNPGEE
jgi:type I restriction enzyme, R subunit